MDTRLLLPIPQQPLQYLSPSQSLLAKLYFLQRDQMENLVQEEKGCGVAGEPLVAIGTLTAAGSEWFSVSRCPVLWGRPWHWHGLGTASCVSCARHPARWHPPQQVPWWQAECRGLNASSWPLVPLLSPSPVGKWREAEGVSQLFEERVLVFSCIFILSALVIQTRRVGHLPVSLLASCPCHSQSWISMYLTGSTEFIFIQFGILGEPLSPGCCLTFCSQQLTSKAGMTAHSNGPGRQSRGFSRFERFMSPRLGTTKASRCLARAVDRGQATML